MILKTFYFRLMYNLWKAYSRIKNFRKINKLDGYQKRLKEAISDQDVEKIILKSRITRYMRKYLKVDARSKYIPKDNKSREESRQQVFGLFGDDMDRLGITLSNDLVLCEK